MPTIKFSNLASHFFHLWPSLPSRCTWKAGKVGSDTETAMLTNICQDCLVRALGFELRRPRFGTWILLLEVLRGSSSPGAVFCTVQVKPPKVKTQLWFIDSMLAMTTRRVGVPFWPCACTIDRCHNPTHWKVSYLLPKILTSMGHRLIQVWRFVCPSDTESVSVRRYAKRES